MLNFLINAAMVTTIFVGGTLITVRIMDYFTDRN